MERDVWWILMKVRTYVARKNTYWNYRFRYSLCFLSSLFVVWKGSCDKEARLNNFRSVFFHFWNNLQTSRKRWDPSYIGATCRAVNTHCKDMNIVITVIINVILLFTALLVPSVVREIPSDCKMSANKLIDQLCLQKSTWHSQKRGGPLLMSRIQWI